MRSKWFRVILGFVAVLLIAYVVLALLAQPAGDHPFFTHSPSPPLVIAHRGGRGLWPENTLYGFEQAVALGVDVLEMDIHSTADGVLVVMHDDTVDRTTNGVGPVHSLILDELKALDAGHNWSADDGQTFPYRGQGIAVPTLEEVFTVFPNVTMNIEIKQADPSIAASFCQLIRDYGKTEQVLVASFDEEVIQEFRLACPEVATSASQNEVVVLFVLSKLFLDATYSPAAQAVQVPEYQGSLHVLTPRFVDAAHSRHLQVHAWTINDVVDMERLVALGVDGIITDYPDRLLKLLGR